MEPLLPSFRRELRARAHHLHPVVSIGQHGLTPAVLQEIDVALKAHELIKVRVFSDDRAEREALLAQICDAMDCAPVQQIGKLLVLWRKRPTDEASAQPRAKRKSTPRDERGVPAPSRRRRVSAGEPVRTPGIRKPPSNLEGGRRTQSQAHAAASAPRVRKTPGKAPAGVPRAAAPRRRRRVA